tara:strand:+ start:2320 stop:3120 length:801 start_codon:yes stop_codon:yes gene_type:complete
MENFTTQDDFETFNIILDKIKNYKKGEKLYYVRFGDGDLIMMYPESEGKVIGRANQFDTTKQIQNELYRTWNIQDDRYMVAGSLGLSSPFSTDHGTNMHNKVKELISSGKIIERNNFYSHPTFESNFIFKPDKFIEFCNLINGYKKVWINQLWHDNIETILGNIEHHIQTPSTNSYKNIDEWYPQLLEVIDDVDVIILATGFSSRVLASRLWDLGINKIVLDIGSVVDMFIANTDLVKDINTRSTMETYESQISESLEYILDKLNK